MTTTINRFILVLSFLTLALVAPASAKLYMRRGLDGLCSHTSDPSYCSRFLRPLALPSTNFHSNDFMAKARDKVAQLAKDASDFVNEHDVVDHRDITASRICANKLRNSVDLMGMNDFDTAEIEQEACLSSLENAYGVMKEAKGKVEAAMMATKVINDFTHRR